MKQCQLFLSFLYRVLANQALCPAQSPHQSEFSKHRALILRLLGSGWDRHGSSRPLQRRARCWAAARHTKACETSLVVFLLSEEGFRLSGQDSDPSSCRAGLEAAPAWTSRQDPGRDLLFPRDLLPGSVPSHLAVQSCPPRPGLSLSLLKLPRCFLEGCPAGLTSLYWRLSAVLSLPEWGS